MNTECIFCSIIKKRTLTKIIYEDDSTIAICDLYPKADIHYLIIPKIHIATMLELESHHQALMGKLMITANNVAKEYKLAGYKLHINVGKLGGQEIFHLHIHLLGSFNAKLN